MPSLDIKTLLLLCSSTQSIEQSPININNVLDPQGISFQDLLNQQALLNISDVTKPQLSEVLSQFETSSSLKNASSNMDRELLDFNDFNDFKSILKTSNPEDNISDILTMITNIKSSAALHKSEDLAGSDYDNHGQGNNLLDALLFVPAMQVTLPSIKDVSVENLVKEAYKLQFTPDVQWKSINTNISEAHVTWSSHGQEWSISVRADKMNNTLNISLPSIQNNVVNNVSNSSELIKYIQDSFKEYMTTRTDLNIVWHDKSKDPVAVTISKYTSDTNNGYNSPQQDNKHHNPKHEHSKKEK